MHFDLIERITAEKRSRVLGACAAIVALIAICDMLLVRDVSLGYLYVLPVMAAATRFNRPKTILMAAGCALLKVAFSPASSRGEESAQFFLGFIAFVAAGLFVVEAIRRRQAEAATLYRMSAAAMEARTILESSPAAILTVHPNGVIDLANQAAHRLLEISPERRQPEMIEAYFPMLGEMLRSKRAVAMVRTMVECRGRRTGGDYFFAQMWLSSFPVGDGFKLVIVVADVSEQMRDREELGLRQLLMSSSIIAGAVSHEIRNLAVAAGMLHTNIGKRFQLSGNEDFDALGRLIEALRKLSAPEAPANVEGVVIGVDLNTLLGELKIIAESGDFEAELEWSMNSALPLVRAEHSGLMQVLLNLLRNSQRALEGQADARIRILAYQLGDSVLISFSDNGPGVGRPETLFQPFQPGAHATGLGLYVSRAIVRTFGGELQYDRRADGSRFVIQLPITGEVEDRDVA
ncbi:MAG: PAS domain-containing protein [Acidobacteria bacterium]|nr:PAS domain-containing protein [Acidobacteriota bacterium]